MEIKMKTVVLGFFAALLCTSGVAMADWGNGQDIADQWGNGSNAYGGSGNPYGGGYHGTSPNRDVDYYGPRRAYRYGRQPILRRQRH